MSKQTHNTSNSMALEQPRGIFGKISIVVATKLKSFNFLPGPKKLRTENRAKSECDKGLSKHSEVLEDHGATEGKPMDEDTYKAEVVYVSDTEGEIQKSTSKSAVALSPTLAVAYAELGFTSSMPSPGTMDTADNKQLEIPQLDNSGYEVSAGPFLNTESQREEEVLSPVSSMDIFTSPYSSKESIQFEGWEQETSWSAFRMPSPSGSVSPCSSVRSGAFSPSVMKIKRHTLSPGSSLMHMPVTSCRTLGCRQRIASPCPLSTHAQHRPPPPQLPLLTAILRKGRLPILSSALQRPYSPCWPISPVNMSTCMACSAASTVSPMVGSHAKSCVSKATTCTELNCKARPKSDDLFTTTKPRVSPKDEDKGELLLTAVETMDSRDSTTNEARSRIISSPERRSPLTLSSHSLTKPSPAHQYKQPPQISITLSTDHSLLPGSPSPRPMSFSPEPHTTQEKGQKSNDVSHMLRNTTPCHTSFSDLKPVQTAHVRSPTPNLKQSQSSTESNYTDTRPGSYLRNNKNIFHELEKIHSVHLQQSTSPRVAGHTNLSNTPSNSPVIPSLRPDSCTSTSDLHTVLSSPAISYHHLSPSPSYSLCSSPTSSLRGETPDSMEGGSKKPHKIKSTYKALAAIPTNTLLQEQQAIDDEVKHNAPLDSGDSFAWEDPHSQMCSPAELRQQSAELYQVIDEVLKDTDLIRTSSPAKKLTEKSVAFETTRGRTPSPLPRSLGRETKYANFHHQPSAHVEKTLTKPGVIRPAVVISRYDDDKERSWISHSFQRQHNSSPTVYQYKLAPSMLSATDEAHGKRDVERVKDFSEVPETSLSSSRIVTNQTREYSTSSPRGTSL